LNRPNSTRTNKQNIGPLASKMMKRTMSAMALASMMPV
jgi:hypothetical protein